MLMLAKPLVPPTLPANANTWVQGLTIHTFCFTGLARHAFRLSRRLRST